jgi:hypothetical protein
VSRSSRGGCTLGFCGWHESRNELRVGDLAPAPYVMPGCRDPISSKGKQQIGPYSVGYGLSKRRQLEHFVHDERQPSAPIVGVP